MVVLLLLLLLTLVTQGTLKSFILGEGNSILCSVLLSNWRSTIQAHNIFNILTQYLTNLQLHQLAIKLKLREHTLKLD